MKAGRTSMALGLVLAACDGTDTDSDPGACGAVTTWDLTVLGHVIRSTGAAVGGATVELRDEGWNPGDVLGVTTTAGSGDFQLTAVGVTSVEGCWGTLLDYRLVASEGAETGERQVNQSLYAAIQDGTLEVDLTAAPLTIE